MHNLKLTIKRYVLVGQYIFSGVFMVKLRLFLISLNKKESSDTC